MKKPKEKKQTKAQLLLKIHLEELGIKTIPEFGFMGGRRLRFDLACPERHLAFECNGGVWSGGHRHGKDIEKEYEKGNLAQMMGWKLMVFSNEQVLSGYARSFMKEWLG